MRIIATNIGASVIVVYLLQQGYSVAFIAFYWAAYFLFKAITTLPVMKFIARVGIKRSTIISHWMYGFSMVLYGFSAQLGLGSIIVAGLIQSLSASIYQICFYIDISSAKDKQHVGNQLAFINILQKVASAISPVIGGLWPFCLARQFRF